MGVLQAVLEWYELPIPELDYFCTLTLARRVWPELRSHALTSLGRTFSIVYNAHNALDDARTCGDIACMAAEKCGSGNIRELLNDAGIRMRKLYY
jgi:DNA polymerase-3 subunit epsilon